MADDKKVTCPDCSTENPADAKRCSKCDLPFVLGETVSLSDVFRIFDARDKVKKTKPGERKEFRLFGHGHD